MFGKPQNTQSLTDQAKFLSGQQDNAGTTQFGPGVPAQPTLIGNEPRLFQYPTTVNLPSPPDTFKRVPYETLRVLADSYDLLRRCLEYRKDEMTALEWSIVPKERKNKKTMRDVQLQNADLIRDIEQFFRYPEAKMKKNGGKWMRWGVKSYNDWLSAILEDLFVIDAVALLPTKKLSGELLKLERIDGATIKVLLDETGRTPTNGPAYQQWMWGMPRWDFAEEELIYRTYTTRNHSVYGFSLVEQILSHIVMAMRNEAFISSYFSEGAIPPVLFGLPSDWSTPQMEELANYLNSRLSGNPKALREFNFLPGDVKAYELKPFQWEDRFVNYISCQTAVLCGIQPAILGLQPANSGLGGKSFSEEANRIHSESSQFLAKWIQNLFTEIIEKYFGAYDLAFCFNHLLEKEERERIEINQIAINSGQKSIDQILVENGEEPEGINRFYVAGDRIYFTPDLLAGSVKGSVSVNLGQIGGIKMPDDTFTEDVAITQDAPTANVQTPNPNQSKDPATKLDTSHTEPVEENKHKPSPPPKQPPGTSYPSGPTVNTVKSPTAEVTKSSNPDDDKRTHELELIFMALFMRLFGRVKYTSNMLSPNLVQSAFAMSMIKQQQLAEALFELKRDVYIDSYNAYAKSQGVSTIDDIDTHTETLLRQSVANVSQQIADTYTSDLQSEFDSLIANGVTDSKQLVDELNTWLRQRNSWKSNQIATTEVSGPWNMAIMDIDKSLDQTSQREYMVQPDDCVCDVCRSMVAANPYTYEQLQTLSVPAHPNCKHFIVSLPTQQGGER